MSDPTKREVADQGDEGTTATSPFRDAVDGAFGSKVLGENDMPAYTNQGVGSNVMALSQMVRGGDPEQLVDKILELILATSLNRSSVDQEVNLSICSCARVRIIELHNRAHAIKHRQCYTQVVAEAAAGGTRGQCGVKPPR